MWVVMRLITIATALLMFAACNNKPAPGPQTASQSGAQPTISQPASAAQTATSAEVEKALHKVAGNDAKECGQLESMEAQDLKKASDCAMEAAKGKKPFLVSYAMPGLTVGVAGTSQGKLFTVQSEIANGHETEPKVDPCPAELRVAQSGRVTCMKAGSMGTMPGSQNPHGANPHGSAPMAPQSSH